MNVSPAQMLTLGLIPKLTLIPQHQIVTVLGTATSTYHRHLLHSSIST